MRKILTTVAESIADEVYYDVMRNINNAETPEYSENWLCFIDEINNARVVTSANSHTVTFPTSIAFVKCVELNGSAVLNDDIMSESYRKCIKMINGLINTGQFAKLPTWALSKVQENEFDINAIGWRLTLELTPLEFNGIC